MKPTEIIFSPAAERELKKLTRDRQRDVLGSLKRLRDSSETLEIEKIKGHPSFFRIKAGSEMRVIFHPLTASRVLVLVVRDRKDAYRGLGGLDGKLQAALYRVEDSALRSLGITG